LAIIPALIITSGGDRYAIPQVSLLELIRLGPEQARAEIQWLHTAPVYRLRGKLLPLVYLDRELQLKPSARPAQGIVHIVVIQADGRPFGLVVDAINDTEEIVAKPLTKYLKGRPLFAGATILGDGRAALVLDVLGIAQRGGVVESGRERCLVAAPNTQASENERQSLLLLSVGQHGRMAIPLETVARLEQVSTASVETADGQEVIQYRGLILPLMHLAREFFSASAVNDGRGFMQVVVCTAEGRSIGLVVDRILDVVEAPLEVQRAARRPGILGSAVIQQQVTDLLDVPGLLHGGCFGAAQVASMWQ
jgi:two-component system chemotaxis sensor kinase CheA